MENLKLRKGLSLISIIIIVVVFISLIATIVIYNINKPQMKFKIAINSLNKEISSLISSNEISDILSKADENVLEISSDISLKANPNSKSNSIDMLKDIQKIINNSAFKLSLVLDQKNDYKSMNLLYNYNNNKAMDASLYYNLGKNYVYLKDVFDKYIVLDNVGESSELTNANILLKQDYQYIESKIIKEFTKNIKNEYISSQKEKLSINDKTINTTKTSLLIGKMINEGMLENILKDLMNDSRCVNILISMFNNSDYTTKDDINTYFTEIINTIKNNTDGDEKFSIYTKGIFNNVVKYELYTSNDKIEYTKLKNKEYDFNISCKQQNDEIFNLKSKRTSKDNYNIDISLNNSKLLNINGKITKKNTDVKYTLYLPSSTEKLEGNYKYSYEIVEKGKKYNDKIELSILDTYFGNIVLSVNNNAEVSNISEEIPSFSYIVNASELDEYDINEIYNNIFEKYPALITVTQDISNIIGSLVMY